MTTTAAVDAAFRRTTSPPCKLTARRAGDDADAGDDPDAADAADAGDATLGVACAVVAVDPDDTAPAGLVFVGEPPAHADNTATITKGAAAPQAAVPDNRDLTGTVSLSL